MQIDRNCCCLRQVERQTSRAFGPPQIFELASSICIHARVFFFFLFTWCMDQPMHAKRTRTYVMCVTTCPHITPCPIAVVVKLWWDHINERIQDNRSSWPLISWRCVYSSDGPGVTKCNSMHDRRRHCCAPRWSVCVAKRWDRSDAAVWHGLARLLAWGACWLSFRSRRSGPPTPPSQVFFASVLSTTPA
jgi:hypothetical protein